MKGKRKEKEERKEPEKMEKMGKRRRKGERGGEGGRNWFWKRGRCFGIRGLGGMGVKGEESFGESEVGYDCVLRLYVWAMMLKGFGKDKALCFVICCRSLNRTMNGIPRNSDKMLIFLLLNW